MVTLVGGSGLRRGRRHSERVEFGEALDFWRVVGVDCDDSVLAQGLVRNPLSVLR